MFKVLKVDGPTIVTDKGNVSIIPQQYADGGKSHPVGADDWRRMRDGFLALPDLLAALERLLHETEDGTGLCAREVAVAARTALAKAKGDRR